MGSIVANIVETGAYPFSPGLTKIKMRKLLTQSQTLTTLKLSKHISKSTRTTPMIQAPISWVELLEYMT